MIIGIVGSEAKKFTLETEVLARAAIRQLFQTFKVTKVVSGRCHLGGVDIYAVQEAKSAGIDVVEYPPRQLNWNSGYKLRNILIAQASDHVVCITVRELPASYNGMRFKICYHCGTSDHIKSGGCWTVKYARSIGKTAQVIVI